MLGEEWKRDVWGSPHIRHSATKRRYVSVTNWYSFINQRATWARVSSSFSRRAQATKMLLIFFYFFCNTTTSLEMIC